jgi:hypothetical protein
MAPERPFKENLMQRFLASASLSASILLSGSAVMADELSVDASAAAPAATAPRFATLDRTADPTGAAADLSFVIPTDDTALGGFATRLDLSGQYVAPQGYGGYANIAISKAFLSADEPGAQPLVDAINDETAISNIEIGGLYHRSLGNGIDLAGHIGLLLPTASDEAGFVANGLTVRRRMADFAQILPDVTTLRIGATPTIRFGEFFVRADVGADVPFEDEIESNGETMKIDPLVRASIGAGYRHEKIAATAELVNVATTGEADDLGQRFEHTAAISASYDLGTVAPSLAFVMPLDENGRGDLWILSAGVGRSF